MPISLDQQTLFENQSGNFAHYHLSLWHLCHTNGDLLEADEEKNWRYTKRRMCEAYLLKTSVLHDTHIEYNSCVSVYLKVWSNQFFGASLPQAFWSQKFNRWAYGLPLCMGQLSSCRWNWNKPRIVRRSKKKKIVIFYWYAKVMVPDEIQFYDRH